MEVLNAFVIVRERSHHRGRAESLCLFLQKSVRLVVNYLKTQKAVVRVSPEVPLHSIIPAICEKCEVSQEHVVLLRDGITGEELELTKSLEELGIKELYAWDRKRGELKLKAVTPGLDDVPAILWATKKHLYARSFAARLKQQNDISVWRAVWVCSVSRVRSGSQDSSVPSRPWLLLGPAPGWVGLWQGAGWPGGGQKEELCYLPELLSVQVCVTRGPRPGIACHLPVLCVGEKERRDMP